MGMSLSDVEQGTIDILVGADIAGKLLTGKKKVLSCGLVAIETFLGWTVMGRVRGNNIGFMENINMFCTDHSVTDLWKLDVLELKIQCSRKLNVKGSSMLNNSF